MRPPRPVRREIALDALPPAVWAAVVAEAERAFGVRGRIPGGGVLCWRGDALKGEASVCADPDERGTRLIGEWRRAPSRPVVLAAAFLCVPVAALAALVLSSRPSLLVEWAVVAALLAVPVAVGLWVGLLGWVRRVRAGRRLRAVMAAAAYASRGVVPERERVLPPDPEPEADVDALPTPAAAVWLTDDEIAMLAARDARIPRARAVAAASAARRAGPQAAEWL